MLIRKAHGADAQRVFDIRNQAIHRSAPATTPKRTSRSGRLAN
ncbi:hypothetical protein [Pseudomonas protegens]|nr:hypothetical protein [Pseudomonas protegens]